MASSIESQSCLLCQRKAALTFHHLIPRKLHRRSHFKKHFTQEQLNQGIYICRVCHSGIHATYDEMTLGKYFNQVEQLLADETLQTHFAWVAKQKIVH